MGKCGGEITHCRAGPHKLSGLEQCNEESGLQRSHTDSVRAERLKAAQTNSQESHNVRCKANGTTRLAGMELRHGVSTGTSPRGPGATRWLPPRHGWGTAVPRRRRRSWRGHPDTRSTGAGPAGAEREARWSGQWPQVPCRGWEHHCAEAMQPAPMCPPRCHTGSAPTLKLTAVRMRTSRSALLLPVGRASSSTHCSAPRLARLPSCGFMRLQAGLRPPAAAAGRGL